MKQFEQLLSTYGTMRTFLICFKQTAALIFFCWCSAGTKFRGKWTHNPLPDQWEGNPVTSAIVDDVITAVKHKTNAEGGDRTHSIAMSARYMDLIFQWSKAECNTSLPAANMEDRQKKTVHLMYRAFSMLAWRTWARYSYRPQEFFFTFLIRL